MLWFIVVLGVLALELLMGFISAIIASSKGYSRAWFWAGFFLDVIGIVIVLSLNDKERINDIEQNIERLKYHSYSRLIYVCDNCGTENEEGQYCKKCGSKLTDNIKLPWRCNRCGHINRVDAEFCVACGFEKNVIFGEFDKPISNSEKESDTQKEERSPTDLKENELSVNGKMIRILESEYNVVFVRELSVDDKKVNFNIFGHEYCVTFNDEQKAQKMYEDLLNARTQLD